MGGFILPNRVSGFLIRLEREYERTDETLRNEIIQSCRVVVIEETTYDSLDGGIYGHDARLYVPLDLHCRIPLKQISKVADAICSDLNVLARPISNEFFRDVELAIEDENDPDFQRAIPFSNRPIINPCALSIWKPGLVRVFISHRDAHKVAANQLAEALERFGISCFVAHDTIEPMTEWRKEILKGLETMEVMLLFLTDDFESTYTNQEVGYALGRGVPIISLKLGKLPPPGFVNHEQGASGRIDLPIAAAQRLHPYIARAVARQERLQEALVNSFVASPDWNEARDRFDRLDKSVSKLTDAQVEAIVEGFYRNDQLHFAEYLINKYRRLLKFLERTTGREFEIDVRILREKKRRPAFEVDLEDDVPF